MLNESNALVVPKGFLRRKFIAPKPANPYIPDVRNTALVEELDTWRLCLVNAANGYGKTSLLAQWYEMFDARDDCSALWVTLDAHDTSAAHVAVSLAIAFQRIDPRFLELAYDLLERDDIEGMITDLVNLMDEVCDDQRYYVICLDDIHMSDSAETDIWMPFLFRFTGENIKCVMSGDWIPTSVQDLLLDSSVIEIRAEDLSFDEQRMRKLAFGLIPGLTEVEFAETRMLAAGWPTAYVFYRLARGRSGADRQPVELLERYYARYFGTNVTDQMESMYYEFLVETSMLEYLHPDLCDKVTGLNCSRMIIEQLYAKNRYVLYDHEAGKYCYMPLFKRFLQSKLLALHEAQIGKLARTAAEWCIENGSAEELDKYLALASDPFYLEASVSGSTGLTTPDTSYTFVEYLLSRPASAYRKEPFLIAVVTWAAIAAGFVDLARAGIATMENLPKASYPHDNFRYATALCDALEGDSEGSLRAIEAVLSDGSVQLTHAFECLLVHMAAENQERLGNLAESRVMYQKAMSLAEHEDSAFYKMFDQYLLARQYIDLGRLDDAVSLAERAIVDCPHSSSVYGEFNTIIAYALICRHQLADARVLLERANGLVSPEANIDIYVDTQVANARLAQDEGDLIGALEITTALIKSIARKTVPRNMAIEAYSTQAALAYSLGDRSVATSCEYVLDEFMDNPDLLRAIPCMQAKALILRMRGEREKALELMNACRDKAVACASPYFLAQIAVAFASFYAEEGKMTQAAVELSKALEISILEGYRSIFLRGGSHIKDLLVKQATNRKCAPSIRRYAKNLLESFTDEKTVAVELAMTRGDVSGYYALTEREHEILSFLNNGLSRGEIAERLHVSENTVKTHLKNVYSKLGVHTRAEAYKASREFTEQE